MKKLEEILELEFDVSKIDDETKMRELLGTRAVEFSAGTGETYPKGNSIFFKMDIGRSFDINQCYEYFKKAKDFRDRQGMKPKQTQYQRVYIDVARDFENLCSEVNRYIHNQGIKFEHTTLGDKHTKIFTTEDKKKVSLIYYSDKGIAEVEIEEDSEFLTQIFEAMIKYKKVYRDYQGGSKVLNSLKKPLSELKPYLVKRRQ